MSKRDIAFASFSLENLVLGLLISESKHGYQLYQDYLNAFSPIWLVRRSKFYAALARLDAAGRLETTVEPQEDRPPRKVHHLTTSGRDMFMKWVYQPVTPMRAVRVEFIAKLRFFSLLSLPHPDRLIDAQIAVCERALEEWRQKAAREQEAGTDPFFQRVYDFRRRQALFLIKWMQACKEPLPATWSSHNES